MLIYHFITFLISDDIDTPLIIALLLLGLVIYFWPSRVAFNKNHPFKNIILIINLFFGWTFLVWVGLLIYVYFPARKTILDPIIDPSGTMSAKEYGKRINNLKTHSNKNRTLKELYELKRMGAITEEEFKLERNKLRK